MSLYELGVLAVNDLLLGDITGSIRSAIVNSAESSEVPAEPHVGGGITGSIR